MLELNPRSRQVQAELRDPYQMHRTISKAFGTDDVYIKARCLYRIDEIQHGRLVALVQSKCRPKWENLTAENSYLAGELRMKEFSPAIKAGQILYFRLRANPSVKHDGKREGIYDESERLAWLGRKGERHGFDVLEARVRSDGKQRGIKVEEKNGTDIVHRTVHSAAVFDGMLRVSNADAFISALENGIGSAKGFGFGLLSIAPLGR